MCGIIAYIGTRAAKKVLVDGLKRLEYRGYDSAGVAMLEDETSALPALQVVRRVGKVDNLKAAIAKIQTNATLGIAHTRWATHGAPSEKNSHPHSSGSGCLSLVHNGIVDNYLALKDFLRKKGFAFVSDTDTEALVHLINYMQQTFQGATLLEAVRLALARVEGTYGIAVVSSNDPDMLVGARRGSPLIVGVGKEGSAEYFLASDASAIVEYTSDVIYLEEGDIVTMSRKGGITIHPLMDLASSSESKGSKTQLTVERPIQHLEISRSEIEKEGHKFFMIKEILGQPRTLANCMRGRVSADRKSIQLGGLQGSVMDKLLAARRFIICACGTSRHAGVVGEYLLEGLAGVSVKTEYASEFRYKKPVLFKGDDVVIVTSQSGETADTLAAVREAKRQGVLTVGIVNVVGSTIARETDAVIYCNAGPEIGVASTKAFTAQCVVFSMLALLLGRRKGKLSVAEYEDHVGALARIPAQVAQMLRCSSSSSSSSAAATSTSAPTSAPTPAPTLTSDIVAAARALRDSRSMLFLGRGLNFPVALEGALKLKEISYIHAEGYPSAELKHGPIALIDEAMPVVVIAPKADPYYCKMRASVEQVAARGGKLIVVTEESNTDFDGTAAHVFRVPDTKACFTPLLAVVPLQLLSYHVADMRGLDVDRPRNLAKSVTVE